MMRELCESALGHPNVRAFLRVIRAGESGQGEEAYRTIYGGARFDAPPWAHPRRKVMAGGYTSTAAGAYQFLSTTWDECAHELELPDFSPDSQDLAAIYLIARRGVLGAVQAGELEVAVRSCGAVWASLPGSPYGQPTIDMGRCRAVYEQYGGTYAPAAQEAAGETQPAPTPPPSPAPADAPSGPPAQPRRPYNPEQEAPTMAPILLAPILQLIPQLISAFGKGDRATKNAAAATAVVDAFTRAVPEAVNTQDAIERATADPTVLQQARAAVLNDPVVLALQEVGGGIGAARQRDDAAMAAGAWYRPLLTPAFLISLLLLGFVGFVLIQVVGDAGGLWRPEDRSQVLMLAVAIVSAVMGYYLGSSLGSARKDDLLTRNSTQ